MAAILAHHHLPFIFGLLGNIVSFLVYLAPLPTFYRIVRKKSTEGFQAIPYSVALFSAMLMLYYAFLKGNALILISINSIGCAIESLYLFLFMFYATSSSRIYTAKLLVLFNAVAFGLIMAFTSLVPLHSLRVTVVGWIGVIFSVCVFAAPLSIMRLVVKTNSVEYMPFSLSFCLTLCAVMWFFYGLLIKDLFIAAPNIPGFILGISQMVLYIMYKNTKTAVLPEFKLQMVDNGSITMEGVIISNDVNITGKLADDNQTNHDINDDQQENKNKPDNM